MGSKTTSLPTPYVCPSKPTMDVNAILAATRCAIATALDADAAEFSADADVFMLGIDSLAIESIAYSLSETLGKKVPSSLIYRCRTLRTLAETIAESDGDIDTSQALVRERDRETFPLSFTQERLYRFQKAHPHDAHYVIWHWYRLRGPLNVGALGEALNQVVRLHDELRTQFCEEDGAFYQTYTPHRDFSIACETGADWPQLDDYDAWAGIAMSNAPPYQLLNSRPYRFRLLRQCDGDHVLCVALHHIICDALSLNVFFRDLVLSYNAYCRGETPAISSPPLRYFEFAAWQRRRFTGEGLDEAMRKWRERLAGHVPLRLPFISTAPRTGITTPQVGATTVTLTMEQVARLSEFAAPYGATAELSVITALMLALHKYSEQVVVALPVMAAGRMSRDLQSAIGFFANVRLLTVDFSQGTTVEMAIQQVRDAWVNAGDEQDLPFSDYVALEGTFPPSCITFNYFPALDDLALHGLVAEASPYRFTKMLFHPINVIVMKGRDTHTVYFRFDASVDRNQLSSFVLDFGSFLDAMNEARQPEDAKPSDVRLDLQERGT